MNLTNIGIIAALVGSIYMSFCTPSCPSKANVIRLFSNVYFHFHHWLSAIVLLYIYNTYDIQKKLNINETFSSLIRGILVGSIAHGLSYKDAFHIIYSK